MIKETHQCKLQNVFFLLIFAQNRNKGYILNHIAKVILMSTHNLCFGSKEMCTPQFKYVKWGVKGYLFH